MNLGALNANGRVLFGLVLATTVAACSVAPAAPDVEVDALSQTTPQSRNAGGVEAKADKIVPAAMDCVTVSAWVQANADRLPTRYDDFIRYPLAYRRAIFSALSAQEKSALWRRHLNQYLDSHPGLSTEQVEVVRRALFIASAETFFAEPDVSVVKALQEASVRAFGENETRLLLATLGPEEQEQYISLGELSCNCTHGWGCGGGHPCVEGDCRRHKGCGALWVYVCNGLCHW